MFRKILDFIKEKKKIILIVLAIIVVIAILVVVLFKVGEETRKNNINDTAWLNDNIDIDKSDSLGDGISYINTVSYVDIFNMKYQNVVNDKIEELLKDNDYTLDNPLIIYNPYGTNTLSFNIYFNTEDEVKVSYEIAVSDSQIPSYSNTLYNSEGEYATTHAYQVIGLIKDETNNIKITCVDKDGNSEEKEFSINVPDTESGVDLKLDVTSSNIDTELENGLYAVLGHDKSFNSNVYLYDNNGILRSELPLLGYRTDRIEFIDGNMLYSYTDSGFLLVNKLGKIEKKYDFDGYSMHHDYIYNEDKNALLILANKDGADTIEDRVILLDLETEEVTEIVDMMDFMPDIYETAVQPEGGNTYGGDELDWIHLNSLNMVGDNDLVLSSREMSTIVYIENAYDDPSVKYLIADESVYKDTPYEDLVLDKDGDFLSQAGQHTITYMDNPDSDDTYYLAMYNNNYTRSRTRPSQDWSSYEGASTSYDEGERSMYYLYEVNEEKCNYKLVKSFDLPYSSIVSSIQNVGNNYVTSSGKDHSFGEYNSDGVLIKQFDYTSNKYAYRVFKYSFNDFWFE